MVDTIQGAYGFLEAKTTSKKKYLYGENKLAANFHVMWFISLFLVIIEISFDLYLSVGIKSIEIHTLTNKGKLLNEWITRK